MKKRGMVGSNISMYIIIAVVAGMFIILGFKLVSTIKSSSEEAELVTLKKALKDDVETLSPLHSTKEKIDYDIPLKIYEICFIDLDYNTKTRISPSLESKYPIIANQVQSGTEDNIYMLNEKGEYIDSDKVENLQVECPGWVCKKNINGKFTLELEGKGDITNGLTFRRLATFGRFKFTEGVKDQAAANFFMDVLGNVTRGVIFIDPFLTLKNILIGSLNNIGDKTCFISLERSSQLDNEISFNFICFE